MERHSFASGVFPVMVRLYGRPGIQPLCLSLQDRHGADVVLLLTLVLADAAKLGARAEDLDDLIGFSRDWREGVILPLRGVRRLLKPRADEPAIHALREDVKGAELAAERIHAEALAQRFAGYADGDVSRSHARAYLAHLGLSAGESVAVENQLAMAATLPRSADPALPRDMT